MRNVVAYADEVRAIFGDGLEVELARRLLDFLAANTATEHITFQLVRQLAPGLGSPERDRAILRTLQFLSGDQMRLLDARFELFQGEQGVFDLSDEEAKAALSNQVDPLTGDPDPNIAERVGIYFSPAPETMRLLSSAGQA